MNDKALIDKITAQPEFGEIETRRVWEPIKKEKEQSDESSLKTLEQWFGWIKEVSPLLGLFLKVIFILAIAALIIWLLIRFTSWLDWLELPVRKKRHQAPPSSLFGLELNKDSLPENIVEAALKLLDNGQLRDAVGLLFRAALSHMVHHSQLPVSDSYTEGECLRLAQQHRPASEVNYFRQLTETWLLLAYAHQPPTIKLTRQLCHSWSQHYLASDNQDNSNNEVTP